MWFVPVRLEISFLMNGLDLVRSICESNGNSCNWFQTFALQEHKNVPADNNAKSDKTNG